MKEQQRVAETEGHVRLPTGVDDSVLGQRFGFERSPEVEDVVVAAGKVGGQQGLEDWNRQ